MCNLVERSPNPRQQQSKGELSLDGRAVKSSFGGEIGEFGGGERGADGTRTVDVHESRAGQKARTENRQKPCGRRTGEIADHDAEAGDAGGLAKERNGVVRRKMMQEQRRRGDVDAGIGEGNTQGVGGDPCGRYRVPLSGIIQRERGAVEADQAERPALRRQGAVERSEKSAAAAAEVEDGRVGSESEDSAGDSAIEAEHRVDSIERAKGPDMLDGVDVRSIHFFGNHAANHARPSVRSRCRARGREAQPDSAREERSAQRIPRRTAR